MRKIFGKQHTLREKGQVLVIVAITLVYLVAIMGLAIDTGYMYISYSRLRRGVDAAALAATGEFKRNYTITGMRASASQQLKLNGLITPDMIGSDPSLAPNNPDVSVTINTCDSDPGNPDICPAVGKIAQKLVQIKVTQDVSTFFLAVIGISRLPITIETIAQAASIDLVLLIQNSEAMTFEANSDANRDPSVCNPNGCLPFQTVKSSALAFVNKMMYFPYDRVAIVTYNKAPELVLPLTDEKNGDTVTPAITGLQVLSPSTATGPAAPSACPYKLEDRMALPNPVSAPVPPYTADPQAPCRLYNLAGVYQKFYDCPMFWATDANGNRTSANDPSWCGTTNPAAGLAMAGNHLMGAYPVGWPQTQVRDDAVWVILMLGTGAPNSAQDNNLQPVCPDSTKRPPFYDRAGCRDVDVLTRHCFKDTDTTCIGKNTPGKQFDVTGTGVYMHTYLDPTNYDAYDRSYDMVDVQVANGVFIFTIGLGAQT